MVFSLSAEIVFPDPCLADEDGLLAIGGDLSEHRLIKAYQNGIFPWFSEGDPILWFSPTERCVLYPTQVVISKSMRKVIESDQFQITTNTVFSDVIAACARSPRKGQDGTWITEDMQNAYIALHKSGYAHSIEVWQDKRLVGGLYGVVVGQIFCGESMFSKVSNASKAAMIWLCKNGNFTLIDCQLPNEHLFSMGAEMMPRAAYLELLATQSLDGPLVI